VELTMGQKEEKEKFGEQNSSTPLGKSSKSAKTWNALRSCEKSRNRSTLEINRPPSGERSKKAARVRGKEIHKQSRDNHRFERGIK